MATPLRAFLMLRLANGDWDIKVSQTLQDLARDWGARPEPSTGAVLHVGYERAPARSYDDAISGFPANVLLTEAAKAALPQAYRSSDTPVAWSAEQEPLYLATDGWGYTAIAPAATQAIENAPRCEGWVAQLVLAHPEIQDELSVARVTDEQSYIEQESILSPDTRRVLGLFRANCLLDTRWDDPFQIARASPPWLTSIAVEELPLTVRLGNVFERCGIGTVGDIAARSMSEMLRELNFGRTSAKQLTSILQNAIVAGPSGLGGSTPRAVAGSLLAAVRQSLLGLDTRARDIVGRRMGLEAAPETLEQVAKTYGLTRERIRQLESKAVQRIAKSEYWDDLLAAKLKSLLSEREYPLPLIGVEAVDVWFEGIGDNPPAAKYILNTLCATPVGIVTIAGVEYLSHIDQGRWDEAVLSARNMLKHAEGQQWTRAHARMMVQGLLPFDASELKGILWSEVSDRCHFGGDTDEAVLLRYGSGADQFVEAVLFESDEPLHFSEIARRASERAKRNIDERRAHNAAADIGHLFGPGTYGLLKHVPASVEQLTALAEEAAEIVHESEEGKQWHASELLAELQRRGVVDDEKIDKHVINIALREQQQLRPLGRMVWVVEGAANDGVRIEVRQALITILQQAGQPLSSQQLRQRLIAVRGINAMMEFAVVDPLIKLDASTWGLNDRDLAVKRGQQPEFLDNVVREMKRLGRPIHINDAQSVFGSDIPARALFCMAANDARLYTGTDRSLHLREWLQ